MPPKAIVSHNIVDRVRFRIPERKGDDVYFARAEQVFAICEGVLYAEANPLTGSLLIQHETDLDALLAYAEARELFILQPELVARNQILNSAAEGMDLADRLLRARTGGALDLRELVFTGLVVASIVQVVRGQTLGAATSLLSSAATVLALHRADRSSQ